MIPASHLAACPATGRLAVLPATGGVRLYAPTSGGGGTDGVALVADLASPTPLGLAAAWAPGGGAFAVADASGGLLVVPAFDAGGAPAGPVVSVPGSAPIRALAWLDEASPTATSPLLLSLRTDGALVAQSGPGFDAPVTLVSATETGGPAAALAVGCIDSTPVAFLAGPGGPPGRLRATLWALSTAQAPSARLLAAAGAPPPTGWLAGLLGRVGDGSPAGWTAALDGCGLAAVAPAAGGGQLAVFALPRSVTPAPADEDGDGASPAPLARLALTAPPGPDGEPALPPWAAAPAGGLAWWGGGGENGGALLASLSAAGDLAASTPPRTACVLSGGVALSVGPGTRLAGGGGSDRLFILTPATGQVASLTRLDPPGALAAACAGSDWDAALSIAAKHGLDADGVHLARWASIRPGRASAAAAAETLGTVSVPSRPAAVAAALAASAPSARAQAELLAWALVTLLNKGVGDESPTPPPPGWPAAAPPPPPPLWMPAARLVALRHRARLATLTDSLGGYTPAAYAAFRDADLVDTLGDLAAAGDVGRCRALLARHPFGLGGGGSPDTPPPILTALARLPETLPVADVVGLLRLALATPPTPEPSDPGESAAVVGELEAAGAGHAITGATEASAAASGTWTPLSPSTLAAWTAGRAAVVDAATGQVQVAGGLAAAVAGLVATADPGAADRLRALAATATDLQAAAVSAPGTWAVSLAEYVSAGPADRARLLLCGAGGGGGEGAAPEPSRFAPPPLPARARAAATLASLTPADRTAALGALLASQPLDWGIGVVGAEAGGPLSLFSSSGELAGAVVCAVDALPAGAYWPAAAELVAEARALLAPVAVMTADEEEEEEEEEREEGDDDASLPRSASGSSAGGDGWAGDGADDDAVPATSPGPEDGEATTADAADATALAYHRLGITAALVDAARCLDEWVGGVGGGGECSGDEGALTAPATPLSVFQLRSAAPATLWACLAAILTSLEGPPPAADSDWSAAVGDLQGVAGAVAAALADGPGGMAAAQSAISAETIAAQAAAGALRCCRWRAARALLAQLDPADAEAAALAGGRHHLGRATSLSDEAVADAAACHALIPHPGGPAATADRAALAALRRLGDYGADLAPAAFFRMGSDRMGALRAAVDGWPAAPRHPDALLALAQQLGLGEDRADEVRLLLADAAVAGGDEGAAAALTGALVRSSYPPAWRAAARMVRAPPPGVGRGEVKAALAFALAYAPQLELGGLLASWDALEPERAPLGDADASPASVARPLLKAGAARLRAALDRVGVPPPVGAPPMPTKTPWPLPSVGDAGAGLGWLFALGAVGGAAAALEAAAGVGGVLKPDDDDDATSGALPTYPPLPPAPARAAALLGMFHAALEVLAPPIRIGGLVAGASTPPPPSAIIPPDLAARLATPAPALWAAAAERAGRPPPPPAAALAAGVAWAERAAAEADARCLREALGAGVDAARWADPAEGAYREAALVDAAVKAAADAAAALEAPIAPPPSSRPNSPTTASNPNSPARPRPAAGGAPPLLAPILSVAKRAGVDGWAATAAYAGARLAGLGKGDGGEAAASRGAARGVRDEVRSLRRRLIARPGDWMDALTEAPWRGLARGHGPQLALWLAAAEDAAATAAGEGGGQAVQPSAAPALAAIRKAAAAAGRAVPALDVRSLVAGAVADALARPALASTCGADTPHPPAPASVELLAAATPDAAPELARAVAALPGRSAGGVRPDDVRLAAACRALTGDGNNGEAGEEAAADEAYGAAARAMAGAGAGAVAAFARVCVLGEAPPAALVAAGVPGLPPNGLPPQVRARAAADAAASLERGMAAASPVPGLADTLTSIQAASSTARALCALRDGGARLTAGEVGVAEVALEAGGAAACLEALVALGCPAGRLVAAARALSTTLGGSFSAEEAVSVVLRRALEGDGGGEEEGGRRSKTLLLRGVAATLAASGTGSGAPPPQLGAVRDGAWTALTAHCFAEGEQQQPSRPPRRDALLLVASLAAGRPTSPWRGWSAPGADGEGATLAPRLAATTTAALPRGCALRVTPADVASPRAAAACFERLLTTLGGTRVGRRALGGVLCGVWEAGGAFEASDTIAAAAAITPCFDALLAAMVDGGDPRDAVALADRLVFCGGGGGAPVRISPAGSVAARVSPPCLAAALAALLAPADAGGEGVAAAAMAAPHSLLDEGGSVVSPGAADLLAVLAARAALTPYLAGGGGGGIGAVEDALALLNPPVWDGMAASAPGAAAVEEDGWASAASEDEEEEGPPPHPAWPAPASESAAVPPWTAALPPHAVASLIASGEPERGVGLAAAHARLHARLCDLDGCLGLGLAYLGGHAAGGAVPPPLVCASTVAPGSVARVWEGLAGVAGDGLARLRVDLRME